MESRPTLRVTLLLNIQRKRSDSTASEQLVRRFADRFWKIDWPGSSHPSVFYDPRALDLEGPGGVLHAKAVIADDAAVFVTSGTAEVVRGDATLSMAPVSTDMHQTIGATIGRPRNKGGILHGGLEVRQIWPLIC
jgi:hypothetical protein